MTGYSEYQVERPGISPEHYAKYYVPVFKNGHKFYKSKHKHIMCPKCGIRLINFPFKEYDNPLCWLCFLKSKGKYKAVKNEITLGWFTCSTNWDFDSCRNCEEKIINEIRSRLRGKNE